jgi:nitrate/nitrite transport system permease protein
VSVIETHDDSVVLATVSVPPPPGGPRLEAPVPPPAPIAGRAAMVLARLSTVVWALVGVAGFVGLWALGSTRVDGLASPTETVQALRSMLPNAFHNGGPNDQGIGLMLKASLARVFSGFLIAAFIGIPLGLLMGSSAKAWKAINPLAQFLRPVSPLAWYPILLIIFVNAAKASMWVICLTSLWPIVLNTAAGAASVPKDQRNVTRVFRLKRSAYVRHVLIPHTIGSTITGLRLSMGTAWMVIVAVEMMSGKNGIGNYVWNSYNAGDMAKVTASVVVIGATGLLLDMFFLRLGRAVSIAEAHS